MCKLKCEAIEWNKEGKYKGVIEIKMFDKQIKIRQRNWQDLSWKSKLREMKWKFKSCKTRRREKILRENIIQYISLVTFTIVAINVLMMYHVHQFSSRVWLLYIVFKYLRKGVFSIIKILWKQIYRMWPLKVSVIWLLKKYWIYCYISNNYIIKKKQQQQ